MGTREDDVSGTAAIHMQNAVLRTLAHELVREGAEPASVDGLQVQVEEEAARLASTMRDLTTARSSRPPASSRREHVAAKVSGTAVRRPRLLVVDDDEAARAAVARWFEDDYDVTTARDGLDGIQRARETGPDVIIADVEMPQLDGISMVARMQNIEALRNVPVVFLTGHTELARIAAGFCVGGYAYLTKPVDLELLDGEVRAALGSPR